MLLFFLLLYNNHLFSSFSTTSNKVFFNTNQKLRSCIAPVREIYLQREEDDTTCVDVNKGLVDFVN